MLCPVLGATVEDRHWHTGTSAGEATKQVWGWITCCTRSREVWAYSAWRREGCWWGDLTALNNTRWEGIEKAESDFSWRCTVTEREARSTDWNAEKIWMAIKKKVLTMRVVKHCNRLSQETEGFPRNIQKPTGCGSEQTLTLLWAEQLDGTPPPGAFWLAWFSPLVSGDFSCSHSSKGMIQKFSTGSQALQEAKEETAHDAGINIHLELSNLSVLCAHNEKIPTNAPL